MWPTLSDFSQSESAVNALLFERSIRFSTGPLVLEEEAQVMEDFSYHRPVLAIETIELLAPRAGSLVLDGTCGGGGHTEAILQAGADVLALDQDPDALEFAAARLTNFGSRVTLWRANFRDAGTVLDQLGVAQIGGALLDLGVSSRQLENADRGFSLMRNGPLDMRMDPRQELTAAEVVNSYTEEDLNRIFRELGEEPAARRIASQIVKMRKETPFRETLTLAKTIEKIVGRHGRRHPATQIFQALRMEVNDELGALEAGLRAITARLEPGSRVAVITFHSLEDRIVKNFFRDRSRALLDRPEWPEPRPNPDYQLALITSKPIEPDPAEQRANPRSRSAKLRVAERIE
jgi:16S rRNA (cytosine1402-N4)-methyltransferase